MPGSFTPGEASSLRGGSDDSWPEKDRTYPQSVTARKS